MTRAILIDAEKQEVREIELPERERERLAAIHKAIGGYLETAFMWPGTGDVLFVDEDGLRHDWPFGFVFLPRFVSEFSRTFVGSGVLVGSGVVVGREIEGEDYPDGYINADAAISLDELRRLVQFWRKVGSDEF